MSTLFNSSTKLKHVRDQKENEAEINFEFNLWTTIISSFFMGIIVGLFIAGIVFHLTQPKARHVSSGEIQKVINGMK
jgi:Mn2+/Fe2+ NRAMP family transporter